MKQLRLSILLTLLISMVGVQAFAAWDTSTKVQVNGLFYYLDNDNNQAQVTFYSEGYYTGNITIPSSITYNTINYSVTSIGYDAFEECSSLTSITIPNSVTSIGNDAFQSCSGLTSITIPNSVTSIGEMAFYDCSGLTSITIPNGVTSIEDETFSRCSGLTSVTIPNSVTSIGNYAFYDCSDLTSVTIPNSVTSIGESAFDGCSSLTSVTIPNSVTSIGEDAFGGCSSMGSIYVMHDNPININSSSLSDLYSQATLYVPAGSKSAYEAAEYWENFSEIVGIIVFADANVKEICVAHWDTDDDGELSIDEAEAVTKLYDYFYGNEDITSFDELVYFTGLTSIGEEAFYECTGLTSVTIPNSVTDIEDYAFAYCSGLTSITIPDGVTSIGEDAFEECSSLTSITIPNSVTSIGDYAFDSCSGLTSVTIGSGVTSIGNGAFMWCPSLTSIIVEPGNTKYDSRNNCNAIIETTSNTLIAGCKNTVIPNSVTSIGGNAFSGCSGLTSVTIPNSVTSIGNQAFYGCSGLTSVTIGSGVTSIGSYAFDGCSNLTSITIGNSVTSIGHGAFMYCHNLTSVTLPNSVTSIGDLAFCGCSGLTSVTIPNSVTSIGSSAFYNCSGLISIIVESGNTTYDSRNNCNAIIETASNTLWYGCKNTNIPNGVTSIAHHAFYNCYGLTFVVIPKSVINISNYAFDGCSALTSVTVDINTPRTIFANTFSNSANATLYVPAGSKSAYEAANYWKNFKEIVEPPASVTIAMKTGSGAARNMIAYSSRYALDFSNRPEIKAYIVCGYSGNKDVLLVHVKVVPPYTGMVIKTSNSIYDGGEYEVPTTSEDYYYSNLLVPVVETRTVTPTEIIDEEEFTNFSIGTLYGGATGFVRITSNWTAHDKSYLRVPTSLYEGSANARQQGGFGIIFEDDEATGISNLNDNVNDNVDANAPRYNIAGQRVGASYKGVVIQNGKKILIK